MFPPTTTDNQKLGRAPSEPQSPVDFAFLAEQTFGDLELQVELLTLFVAQARRVVASLPELGPGAQGDAAHLLKGSARGIGAWAAAAIADEYEQGDGAARDVLFASLDACFARTEAVISRHLAAQGR